MRKHYPWLALAFGIAIFAWRAFAQAPAPVTPDNVKQDPIPAEYAARMLKIVVDEDGLGQKAEFFQQQLQQLQQTYQHDQMEIEEIKTETLKSANRDPKDWDIDPRNAAFIQRAKAPAPPAPSSAPAKK